MPPTLARRYIYKLMANLVSVPVYLVMEALLPRALGPNMYGNYSFATNLFQQLSGFLDMGTSTCFYNALSRRQDEPSLFAFYLRIAALVAVAMAFCGLVCLLSPAGHIVMPDMPLWLAPLAALWAFFTWFSRVLRSTNDALGATIPGECWRAGIAIGSTLLLVCLYGFNLLNVHTLFLQQYILLASTCIACWFVTKRHWREIGIHMHIRLGKTKRKQYGKEFFAYSHPLFMQGLLSFFMLTAERWLLQWFDGSAQQGFYALSQKVSMACFLFVSAMTPLLMREFSMAWGRGDLAAMGSLLRRFAPGLYAIATYFSCFTVAEGRALVEIFGGADFVAATLPVQIMALYPLHQAYGQMASSIFHASGKTHILRNMTACECIYGLIAAWVLIAPANMMGFNLGATGLAIKTVSIQFLTVNLYLWLACRFVPFSFWKNLLHQILCVVILIALAYASRSISMECGMFSGLMRFIASGFIYTCFVASLFILAPDILGVSRNTINIFFQRLRGLFR